VTIGVTVDSLPSKGLSRRSSLEMGSVTTVTVVTMNCRGCLKAVRHSTCAFLYLIQLFDINVFNVISIIICSM
jgi:hypothetical protein